MGGVNSIDRMKEGASPAPATSSSLIVAAAEAMQDQALRQQRSQRRTWTGNLRRFAWPSTVRAISNRPLAQTSTRSVVRTAVARRVLSTSETARCAQSSAVRRPRGHSHAFQAAAARSGPQNIDVAPHLSPFTGSRRPARFDGCPKTAV